jgi:hypothetical protein
MNVVSSGYFLYYKVDLKYDLASFELHILSTFMRIYVYCHDLWVTKDGVWIGEWIY